jgi:ADP-ribosylglycohydrolase
MHNTNIISQIELPSTELVARIHGCWLGKAIGGTLGTPHEGKPGPLNLSFYNPEPKGILPNDDLDLQLVWLHHLQQTGSPSVTPDLLSKAWQQYVEFPYDEYAVCLRNAAYGFEDHWLGAFDNWFSECMGAAIRSEMWACLAPGNPERAAGLAWSDAVCDHAGDGVWAEIFFAALQSAAFVESDMNRLLDSALDFLPSSSRVRRAIVDTRAWWAQSHNWMTVRNLVLEAYGEDNFTDVGVNLAFTVLGWLAGGGDFGDSICIATNCGKDTDCTAATLGALLGILSPDSIPAKWKAPVGDMIVLSPQIVGMSPPRDIKALTALTLGIRAQLEGYTPAIGEILPREPASADHSPIRIPIRYGWSDDTALLKSSQAPSNGQFSGKTELPGHWIRRSAQDFQAPTMVLNTRFHLDEDLRVHVAGWSQTGTAVWVDGVKPASLPADPVCSHSQFGAPSFHRGGSAIFEPSHPLSKGWHDLTIAWERPANGDVADLAIGIARAATNQWLPDSLTKQPHVVLKEELPVVS